MKRIIIILLFQISVITGIAETTPSVSTTTDPTIPTTRLAIKDTRFIINDSETFLYGISFYGALGGPKEQTRADLVRMKTLGLNWIRVWATWGAFENNVTVVNADGSPREPFLSQLQWLVAECDKCGIIVDVSLSRGNGVTGKARLQDLGPHKQTVETIIAALYDHANWYLDLSNERNIKDQRYTPMADLAVLRLLARERMPSLLVTSSHAGDIDEKELHRYIEEVKLDFISPHRPRDNKSPSRTAAKTQWYLDQMKAFDRVVPVHYQEPFRRDFSANWNPSASDFIADARAALDSGAAGWCLHNGDNRSDPDGRPRRSFDLRDGSLFIQLDMEERKALDALATVFKASVANR